MAITRAQQVRQMLEDGGMLVQPSTTGKRPGYRSAKGMASKSASSKSSKSSSKSTSAGNQNTGNARDDYRANYSQKSIVKGGGSKKSDGTFGDRTVTGDEGRAARDAFVASVPERTTKQNKFNPFPIATSVLDKISNSKLAKYNNLFQRNNYLRTLNADQQVALLERLAEEEEIGTTNPMGIDRNIQRGMGTYDYMNPEKVDKGFLGTGIGAGKFVTDIEFGGKDAKDTINEAMTKYNEDLASGLLDNDASVVLGDDQPGLTYDEYLDRNKTTTGGGGGNQQQTDPCLGPNPPAYCKVNNDDDDDTTTRNLGGLAPRFAGSIFNFDNMADGGRAGAMDGGMMSPEGGIMDLESGRQMYFLGKLVKKATRAVKKVAKSPFGKMALMAGLSSFGGGGGLKSLFSSGKGLGFKDFLTKSFLGPELSGRGNRSGGILGFMKNNPYLSILGGSTLLAGLSGKGEDEGEIDYGPGIDIDRHRYAPYRTLAPGIIGSNYQTGTEGRKDGGRMGYAEGSKEPVAKETMPLLDMDGQEMDLRAEGGFVPLGRMERADDVPARLSKNEFVFTADAVRNAGEGDIDKGAEVMYNMMKNLESGGEVSEESQGLDGAREMFQTSQRLEEVL